MRYHLLSIAKRPCARRPWGGGAGHDRHVLRGAYGAAQKEHMIDPYMAETGVNILFSRTTAAVSPR